MNRPFLKAQPRKESSQTRRKGKTLILTDTPVKAQLEAYQRERTSRKTKRPGTERTGRLEPTGLFNLPNTTVQKSTSSVKKQKLVGNSSSEQDNTVNIEDLPQVGPSKILKAMKKTVRKKATAAKRQVIEDDDDTPCAVCGKRCNEPPLEDWKQCLLCKQWFHERCCPDETDTCYMCLSN